MRGSVKLPKLKVLDTFAGIGGFSLGLERTGGFETVAFCEIDKFCQKVLKKHWPEVPIFEDVRTLDYEGPVDMVTAGFPCQDISFAGKGAGLSGERSGLFWEILRTLRLVGYPKLLLENVAGLLNRGMGEVLGALASIGYDSEWHCIPAGRLNAAHQRDRIWIVANPQGIKRIYQPIDGEISQRLPDNLLDGKARLRNAPETRICRMDDGIPGKVDRYKSLGNSVYVEIPQMIGNAILEAESCVDQ